MTDTTPVDPLPGQLTFDDLAWDEAEFAQEAAEQAEHPPEGA